MSVVILPWQEGRMGNILFGISDGAREATQRHLKMRTRLASAHRFPRVGPPGWPLPTTFPEQRVQAAPGQWKEPVAPKLWRAPWTFPGNESERAHGLSSWSSFLRLGTTCLQTLCSNGFKTVYLWIHWYILPDLSLILLVVSAVANNYCSGNCLVVKHSTTVLLISYFGEDMVVTLQCAMPKCFYIVTAQQVMCISLFTTVGWVCTEILLMFKLTWWISKILTLLPWVWF